MAVPAGGVAQQVLESLRNQGWRLAVAESCTGGLVAAALTAVPGASRSFAGGVVAYSNDSKERVLGVAAADLRVHGAVSEAVALGMAQGVKRGMSCDVGLAVTGIAGPDGGTPGKPVGTVWIGVSTPTGASAAHHLFAGSRDEVRSLAVAAALEMVAKSLG